MQTNAYFIIFYGIIVIIGGVIGYQMAGSTPSLIMGLSFGLLLVLSGISMLYNSRKGLACATILATLLALFFLYRLVETGKWMPAGVMAALSLLIVAYSARRIATS